MADTVLFRVEGGLAWITLNRPEARNAINDEMRQALLDALARVAADPVIRAAVLTGAGEGFCPGADLWGGRRRRRPARRGARPRTLQQGGAAGGARGGGARVGRAARPRPDARARHVEAPPTARLRERARDLPRGGGALADAGRRERGHAGGRAGLRGEAEAGVQRTLNPWRTRSSAASACST